VRRSGKTIKQPSLLVGLLFDGKGGRMGSHHACKPGKEYRYYLSDSLMAEAKRKRPNDVGEGLRLPAQEIENHVIATVAAFLSDTQKLIAECCPKGTPPSVSSAAVRLATTLAVLLKTGNGQEHYELIRTVVKRVQVFEKSICVTLGRRPLAAQLQIPVNATMQEPEAPLELSVPAELRRIGKEKRLIVAALVPKTNPDAILIKAIVRAHLWFGMLRDRKVASISELAEAEQLPRTYVGSVIPFAFLAPDITEAILNGTQPIDLNLDRLINATLPLDWAEQRTLLGFN
jgi:site-specific DNA recombinase